MVIRSPLFYSLFGEVAIDKYLRIPRNLVTAEQDLKGRGAAFQILKK